MLQKKDKSNDTSLFNWIFRHTEKKLKKTIKQARKALKKMNIAVRKGYETSKTLAREQERWANLIVNAEADFIKEKELFKAQDNKKPVVKKLVSAGKK